MARSGNLIGGTPTDTSCETARDEPRVSRSASVPSSARRGPGAAVDVSFVRTPDQTTIDFLRGEHEVGARSTAKKRTAHDEEAWAHAKKICRLNARQVEMARALGIEPEETPGFASSPAAALEAPGR